MKPILFNAEMVRAILEGRKAVTRRVVKPQPPATSVVRKRGCAWEWSFWADCDMGHLMQPPYQPGDTLWVRETFRDLPVLPNGTFTNRVHYYYKADGDLRPAGWRDRWRPSIHMPREAARIFLRVKGVRVERLQDISREQAIDEGVNDPYDYQPPAWYDKHGLTNNYEIDAFAGLWDSTIKPADLTLYGWEANPWVFVIEFERISKDEAIGGGGDG